MRWRYVRDEQLADPSPPLVRRRPRRVMLAHVDGHGLGSWPLGGVVRTDGRAYRVTRHQGVPPAAGELDWSFDVWGIPLRLREPS